MTDYLFAKGDLSVALSTSQAALEKEVADLPREAFGGGPSSTLPGELQAKYLVAMVELLEGDIAATTEEVEVRATDAWDRVMVDPGAKLRGNRVTYFIPFTGDAGLLALRTNPYTSSPPLGRVTGSEIVWHYEGVSPDPAVVRAEFERNLAKIRDYLGWAGSQVQGFNAGLPGVIDAAISKRQLRLDAGRTLAEGLGVKQRHVAPAAAMAAVDRPDIPPDGDRRSSGTTLRTADQVRLAGEGKTIEFKASLRWDYKQSKVNKALQDEVLETIAAFLNASGGDLLIGVHDNRDVIGIEADLTSLHSLDAYGRTIASMCADLLGPEFTDRIDVEFEDLDGKQICHVRVSPAHKPAFLRDHLFVRVGPTTRKLAPNATVEYVASRWKGPGSLKAR